MIEEPDGPAGQPFIRLRGEGRAFESTPLTVEHVEEDDGETQIVRVEADLYNLTAEIDFLVDDAEQFLILFRDEIVRAKRAELEWETDTDPDTGIAGESHG